jgi:hypothetical protein
VAAVVLRATSFPSVSSMCRHACTPRRTYDRWLYRLGLPRASRLWHAGRIVQCLGLLQSRSIKRTAHLLGHSNEKLLARETTTVCGVPPGRLRDLDPATVVLRILTYLEAHAHRADVNEGDPRAPFCRVLGLSGRIRSPGLKRSGAGALEGRSERRS